MLTVSANVCLHPGHLLFALHICFHLCGVGLGCISAEKKRVEGLEAHFFISLSSGRSRTLQDYSFLCLSENRPYRQCLLFLRSKLIKLSCVVQQCKVLKQQAMDKDVAAADLAE